MQVITPDWQKKIEGLIDSYDQAASGNLYTAFNGIEVMDDDFMHACILLTDHVDRHYGSPSAFSNFLQAAFHAHANGTSRTMDSIVPASAGPAIDDQDAFAKAGYIANAYRPYKQNAAPSSAPIQRLSRG